MFLLLEYSEQMAKPFCFPSTHGVLHLDLSEQSESVYFVQEAGTHQIQLTNQTSRHLMVTIGTWTGDTEVFGMEMTFKVVKADSGVIKTIDISKLIAASASVGSSNKIICILVQDVRDMSNTRLSVYNDGEVPLISGVRQYKISFAYGVKETRPGSDELPSGY